MTSKRITLTDDEIDLIDHALRIAAEDGSIYGGAEGEETDEINTAIDRIYKKIGRKG